MFTAEAPTRAATLSLWREMHTLITQLFMLFGEPQAIAFQHTLKREAHALLSKWLRGAEALLRQLLLVEAAAFVPVGPATSSPASTSERTPTVRERRMAEH